jgi:hypothetical protein
MHMDTIFAATSLEIKTSSTLFTASFDLETSSMHICYYATL